MCRCEGRGVLPRPEAISSRGWGLLRRQEQAARNDTMRGIMGKEYCVYIMTNKYNTVFYTGVTNNIIRRVWEHKEGFGSVFTSRYRVTKLVYYESYENINLAIAREKQIKGGSRQKKIDLVNGLNPEWKDLYEEMLT
jgi:putative endonuclease